MKVIAAVLVVACAAGCATIPVVDTASIRSSLESVDRSDGINKQEAIILAKNYMLDHGHDKKWDVTTPEVYGDQQKPTTWNIQFRSLENGWGSSGRRQSEIRFEDLLPIFIHVDKKDGSVNGTKINVTVIGNQ